MNTKTTPQKKKALRWTALRASPAHAPFCQLGSGFVPPRLLTNTRPVFKTDKQEWVVPASEAIDDDSKDPMYHVFTAADMSAVCPRPRP